VTGGAGFLGSHLVDRLMGEGFRVTVLDDLSTGRMENLGAWQGDGRFTFIRGDMREPDSIPPALEGAEVVFHFAANPEVAVGEAEPYVHFGENVVSTFNLLEAMRGEGSARALVFASTSTVYGDADRLPTPEEYGPCLPISTYGGSKLACEALISAYAGTFGLSACILRLANIVGPRMAHGAIVDFVRRLRRDPERLEILGDGTQRKSYLHSSDCLDACMAAYRATEGRRGAHVYNVGSEDQLTVMEIARAVAEEMGLKGTRLEATGGVDGGRGWRGDVKYMLLDISRLKALGWAPRLGSGEAVRLAVREILRDHNRY